MLKVIEQAIKNKRYFLTRLFLIITLAITFINKF